MPNIVYIAASLDGYIARKDGNLDWLMDIPNPDGGDYGFASFTDRIDGIVMGRNTFETVLAFNEWPYTKPVFVLSSTLAEIPVHLEGKAEIARGDVNLIVDSLRQRGLNTLYIDGGKTVQSFLRHDLVDELIITRVPVLLGTGVPLFSEMDFEMKLDHVETEVFSNGLVKSTYTRKN